MDRTERRDTSRGSALGRESEAPDLEPFESAARQVAAGSGTEGTDAGGTAAARAGVCQATDRLVAAVSELLACSVDDLAEPDASRVHAQLRRAQDALAVMAARVLAQIEADGRWATSRTGRGARDLEDWLAKESHGTRAGARRQTRIARAVQEDSVPGLAQAVVDGQVTLEHAEVLTRLAPTTPARRDALAGDDPDRNAAHLLAAAARLGADELVNEVRRWAATVDPTADERGQRDAAAKVSCTLTRRDDGVAVTAFLTATEGAALDTALTAVAGVPSRGETRTHAQRMGTALADMARLVLDHGVAADRSGGFRPHLSVHVSYDTLMAQINAVAARAEAGGAQAGQQVPSGRDARSGGQARSGQHSSSGRAESGGRARSHHNSSSGQDASPGGHAPSVDAPSGDAQGQVRAARKRGGDVSAPEEGMGPVVDGAPQVPAGFDPAVLSDGTPIPAGVLARLACDAEVTRVVFGPSSQVLDVGRAERVYTRAVRRAVIARDLRCTFPGCDRPPKYGEIHHIRHWAAPHGETSVANGILLCWHHHDVVHTRHLTIDRDHARARWLFREPDGRLLDDEVHAASRLDGTAAEAAGAPRADSRATPGALFEVA